MSIIDIAALGREHERLLDSHTELHEKYDQLKNITAEIVKHTKRVILISDREHSAWNDAKIALNNYEQFKEANK